MACPQLATPRHLLAPLQLATLAKFVALPAFCALFLFNLLVALALALSLENIVIMGLIMLC